MDNFTIPNAYTARNTEDLATISYVGYSKLETLESSAEWVIQRIETTVGVSKIRYAEGSWDDRATLIYK